MVEALLADDGWMPAAKDADLFEGKILAVKVNDVRVALYRLAGVVFATENACPHAGIALSKGSVEGETIICPWHRACYNIKTGKLLSGPAEVDLRTYPARVRDGTIEVQNPISSPEC